MYGAVYCRLRSASRGVSYFVWGVYSAGYLGSTYASYAYRALPDCAAYPRQTAFVQR